MKTALGAQKSSEILIDASATSIPIATGGSSTEDSNEESPPDAVSNVTAIVRNSSGPRTTLGKERSKHNALRHGVFSNVVLLKDEPKAEFDMLLNGLREDYHPEGAIEEVLVEKLATLLWRQRRVLAAESGEIRKHAEFLEWNQERKELAEAKRFADSDSFDFESGPGLMDRVENPHILNYCLQQLEELRRSIKADDSTPEYDERILKVLQGQSSENVMEESLCQSYRVWQRCSEIPEEERKRQGYPTPEDCKAYMLERIDLEVRRLKKFQKENGAIEKSRIEIDKLRQHVPDDPRVERLLRYETTLERIFDRTLNQLERIQRMRKGQIIPPPIKLDVTTS